MSFQFVALAPEPFAPLFALSDDALRSRGILRRVADSTPGFPCRVSLEDAAIGEELLLLPFEHQPGDSPYRASGPVYVSRNAQQAQPAPGEVPACVVDRLVSVRGYDAGHLMVEAAVCEGARVQEEIARQFANASVAYLHVHNARPGCYSCAVIRA